MSRFVVFVYGLLAYYSSIVGFLLVASKLGLQHAALRFYSDTQKPDDPLNSRVYHSTMTIGGIAVSLVLTAFLTLGAKVVIDAWDRPDLAPERAHRLGMLRRVGGDQLHRDL